MKSETTTQETQFPVTITEQALKQLQRIFEKHAAENTFLRIGVKGGGCSGLEYVLKLDTNKKPYDIEDVQGGLPIVCDSKSAVYLQGATLDYTGNLIGGGFKFDNPNAKRGCGCGTSFTPKDMTSK